MRFNKLRRYRELGELRNWITVEFPISVADNRGGLVTGWNQFQKCWAKIEAKTGRQVSHADAPEKRVTHIVTVRWMDVNSVSSSTLLNPTNVSNRMRVNWNGRLLQIHYIMDIQERERYVELHCEEGALS